MRKISLIALTLVVIASSCSREEVRPTVIEESGAITVEASVNESTKAVTTNGVTTFVEGDKLSLFVWTGDATAVPVKKVVDGVVNTYDGSKWTPAVQMLWKNIFDAHFFLGIFPSRTVTSFTQDPVTSGEDLLVATVLGDGKLAPQSPAKAPVALVFDHMMAKLNINVKFRNQWGDNPTPVVKAGAAPAGTIDYLSKTITPGTVSEQGLSATTAASGYNATYTSLFIPQAGVRSFYFTIDGQTLVYTHSSDIPLVAGKVTTLSVLVGKDKIDLIDNTVTDWSEGTVDANMDPNANAISFATRPLTLKAKEDGTTVSFRNWSQGTVTCMTSNGGSRTIASNGSLSSITLKAGERVWFVGDGNNNAFSDGTTNKSSLITISKDCEVYGNIMSLLGRDFSSVSSLPGANTFAYLFNGQSHLVNNAEEGILLPATTLTSGCYKGMFSGCTGLSQVTINATDISAGDCLSGWLEGITTSQFGLVTVDPLIWQMGGNLPWGVTAYTPGDNGPEANFKAPTPITGTLTYNGSAQKLLNAGTAIKSGVVLQYSTDGSSWDTTVPTGTNAGNYTAYCRVQGGVTSAAIPVTINKAANTVTLNPTSLSFTSSDGVNSTKTVSVTRSGNGTVSVSSSNANIATVSVSGTTVTVTRKSGGSGSATITVNVAEGTNYLVASKTFNVTLAACIPSGALMAEFSVSSTQKVYFSKGCLQYKASTNTWRFAEHQYDIIGADNVNISSTYSGWIDLFGWGTSGKSMSNYGSAYQPYSSSVTDSDYGPKGNYNLTGTYAQGDWGVNMGAGWRTLSKDEWEYLIFTRTVNGGTGNDKSYTLGQQLNGIYVLVIYPDDYTGSAYTTGSAWSTFEAAGCVCLPAGADRDGKEMSYTSLSPIGNSGYYWTSTAGPDDGWAYEFCFGKTNVYHPNKYYRRFGKLVRLVYNK